MASVAALALAVAPASAKAATPVLEFVPSSGSFPVSFTADGGEVTAALAGYDTVVHCDDSSGWGEIIGPRTTVSQYIFTGCETQGGTENGQTCQSEGANPKEIRSEQIQADLVYLDQANHQVAMLLNSGGTVNSVYLEFKCATEPVKAIGRFLSPVDPINEMSSSFTASLSRSGNIQTPNEYENALGEKTQAIPTGERGGVPAATTGVELSFEIVPEVPLEIRAVNSAEVEAKQREEEAAAAKKRQAEEAAAARKRQEDEAAAKQRQDEDAARVAAESQRRQALAKTKRLKRQLATSLKHCRHQGKGKGKRVRCEKRAKKKYNNRVKGVTQPR